MMELLNQLDGFESLGQVRGNAFVKRAYDPWRMHSRMRR